MMVTRAVRMRLRRRLVCIIRKVMHMNHVPLAHGSARKQRRESDRGKVLGMQLCKTIAHRLDVFVKYPRSIFLFS